MYKFQLIGLLVIACLGQQASNGFYLSPPLPPTTYLGEYYTVQFRVIGMNSPTFSFENLPACFTSTSNGTIQGIPDQTGSFAVRVNFQSSEGFGSKDIVIRVTQPNNINQDSNNQLANRLPSKATIVISDQSLTYWTGAAIELILRAINGKQPYTWNYINLPIQIKGNPSGIVTGAFDRKGYYTFSVSACDSLGLTADAYFTFNIQPFSAAKSLSLMEVPNMVSIRYDLDQVYNQQIVATNALFQAARKMRAVENETNQVRDYYKKTSLLSKIANDRVKDAEQKLNKANNNKSQAANIKAKSQSILLKYQNNLQISQTNFDNTKNNLQSRLQNLPKAQEIAYQLNQTLTTVRKQFIKAQSQSSFAAQNVKIILSVDINARNDYNLAFGTLSNRRHSLQKAQNQSQIADILVGKTQNAAGIARKMCDDAESNLTSAHNIFVLTKQALNLANQDVQLLKGNLKDAVNQVGTAEFNLHQSISAIYIAQARKEQADKATEMVRFQTSTQANLFLFTGCQQMAYPTITGSAIVVGVSLNGFRVSTGSQLLYGNCTQVDKNIKNGDIINYNGYVRQGVVQCTFISKIL